MALLHPAGKADRDDAAAFAGRVARWDAVGPIRLKVDGELVRLWATTPFDTLATRAVHAGLQPSDATVHAGNLLSALAVGSAGDVDPGTVIDAAWRSQLPPQQGWITVDDVPAKVLAELADSGVERAKSAPGPAGGASTALLDSEAITVSGNGMRVVIPMRMLMALSGMGFAPPSPDELVRVSATDAWMRIDARYGAVVRRRHALLPLMF
ncbi:hypothetical protein [Nakamurella lactea]|uniref:hypothetical protein n=1 Tax=Nakamurella lactea TaxID=459515 RepID=UPI0003FA7E8D|nr:hypothetical protein [Nakamurella lactea]